MWAIPADCAFPSATENEISDKDALNLLHGGVYVISEGANMPTVPEGMDRFLKAGILYGPGKAANAGGVAVSGLEMSQDSLRVSWPREEVDARLKDIMKAIHKQCRETAEDYGVPGNYVVGANVAGFVKVADAMLDREWCSAQARSRAASTRPLPDPGDEGDLSFVCRRAFASRRRRMQSTMRSTRSASNARIHSQSPRPNALVVLARTSGNSRPMTPCSRSSSAAPRPGAGTTEGSGRRGTRTHSASGSPPGRTPARGRG
jgi:hypothetical protein